ncbi:hypothetical protein LINPERHAP1_LOCUS30220 [Linum perenne]
MMVPEVLRQHNKFHGKEEIFYDLQGQSLTYKNIPQLSTIMILIIFDYEGHRFFKTDADNLYAASGETRQTPPNFVMQLIGQEMKFQIKFPSYLTIPLTEYPVYRILGVMEAVPPTADAGKEEKYISGSSSSQSPTSSLTVTETPVGVPAGNLNLADTINLGGEDSPIHQAVNVITDDMPPTNAKEATRKRRKIIIKTSDSEKE